MSRLQREILSTAKGLAAGEMARHPLFSPHWDELTIVLSGSAVAPYADRFSGIDLVLLGPEATIEQLEQALKAQPLRDVGDGFREITMAAKRLKFTLRSLEQAGAELDRYDDFALLTFPGAPVIHDPRNRFPALVAEVGKYPPAVLQERIDSRYQRFRRRRASIAWNLRRGQPFMLLNNLTLLLDHTLSLCFYLDGRPPVGRKWLLQEGLRTAAGRRLRPALFELFSSLGEVATLGGTLQPRNNRIYTLISDLQAVLEEAFSERANPKS